MPYPAGGTVTLEKVPEHVSAEAGFFRVVMRVPGPLETCIGVHENFDEWMGAMAESDFATGLGALPSVRVEKAGEDSGDLVLEWARSPADGPWDAVETLVNEVAKVAFPDLLLLPDELAVIVTRVEAVGRDVVLDDATLEDLNRQADDQLRWPN